MVKTRKKPERKESNRNPTEVKGGKGKIHLHPKANTNGFDKNPENINKDQSIALEGIKKKRLLKDIAECTVSGNLKEMAEKVAKLFGIPVGEVDVETLADLRQVEKAILKGDTQAYNAFKDRLRGKAMQGISIKADTDVTIKIGGNAEKDKS